MKNDIGENYKRKVWTITNAQGTVEEVCTNRKKIWIWMHGRGAVSFVEDSSGNTHQQEVNSYSNFVKLWRNWCPECGVFEVALVPFKVQEFEI